MKVFAEAARSIGRVVALDGKALRRAYEHGKSHMPPVMVTAWSAKTRMALANTLAPGNNEAAGALELDRAALSQGLRRDDGCACIASAIRPRPSSTREGDYVLAVKSNQPGLLGDAKAAIAAATRKAQS